MAETLINDSYGNQPTLKDAGHNNSNPREDPKSRSLNGGSYKVPLVV